MDEDGNPCELADLFLAVGAPIKLEFIGLQQTAATATQEDDADETDLMDFDMI